MIRSGGIAHRFAPVGRAAGCRICGLPLSFHQQVAGQLCGDWRCKAAQLEAEMVAARRQAALVLDVDRPESYALVVVPDDPARVHAVPSFRHRAHINRLFDLCVSTNAGDSLPDAADAAQNTADIVSPSPLASAICAVCRGACCHQGGEHAFLDPAAMRGFMARSGGIVDPLEVVYAYAARLPRWGVEEGCVYQAETGCTLPRWMRAAICNAYRCQGLRKAEEVIGEMGTGRFFVVVRKDNRIRRGAFVDGEGIRHYPAEPSVQTTA